jgi:hypothetical protein
MHILSVLHTITPIIIIIIIIIIIMPLIYADV